MTYTSDAVSAFVRDLERIGRGYDVALMIFSEFGRRVPENVTLGTDHGAANVCLSLVMESKVDIMVRYLV